jgi:hypothetical protein
LEQVILAIGLRDESHHALDAGGDLLLSRIAAREEDLNLGVDLPQQAEGIAPGKVGHGQIEDDQVDARVFAAVKGHGLPAVFGHERSRSSAKREFAN